MPCVNACVCVYFCLSLYACLETIKSRHKKCELICSSGTFGAELQPSSATLRIVTLFTDRAVTMRFLTVTLLQDAVFKIITQADMKQA